MKMPVPITVGNSKIFKFPSPIPDENDNNVMVMNISKRKNQPKKIEPEEVLRIFGIQENNSHNPVQMCHFDQVNEDLLDDGEGLCKRLYRPKRIITPKAGDIKVNDLCRRDFTPAHSVANNL